MKFLVLVIILSTTVAAQPPLANPGCPDNCGNVTIPFPYGIGPSCYYSTWSEITCNSTSGFKPMLTKFNLEVLHIGLGSKQVTVNNPMYINCSTQVDMTWNSPNLGGGPYSYSIDNVFAPVGCAASSLSVGQDNMVAKCGSQCDPSHQYQSSSTSGESVCLTSPPFPLSVYSVNITASTKGKGTCNYAFLVDRSYLDNSDQSVSSIGRNGSYMPVTLNWKYRYFAGPSSGGSNPNCIRIQQDDFNCTCPLGEGGNPFLPKGCQKSERCASCDGECHVSTDDLTLTQPVVCIPSRKSRERLEGVTIGLSIGIGLIVMGVGCFWLRRFSKRRKEFKQREKYFKRNGGLLLQQQTSSDNGVLEKTKIYTVSELSLATDHFNQNRILGHGGQGTVYKGMLTDGRIIAVKKSIKVDETQIVPFINEVVILSQINHRNVVKLLGCCLETEVPLLVYEFIPNGSLWKHLHYPSEDSIHISWKMRLQIAAESARAIAYLHSSSSTPIYHRDIKSSNILLDDKYRAKVSDFGTSRTFTVDQTHMTTQIHGTFGYLDPEYFQSNQFTEKSDVYSFGVVLVELLTSKRPIPLDLSEPWKSLATEFLSMMENSLLYDIVDPQVLKEAKWEDLIVVANLAKVCLNLNGKQRPTMREVANLLEGLQVSNGSFSIQQTIIEQNHGVADVIEEVGIISSTSTTFSPH